MDNPKTFFITGATGNQGGATARNLLAQGHHVKALVRDINHPNAKALQDINAQLVKGDLDDVQSYRRELDGADGVFSLHTYRNGVSREIAQARALADAAVIARIKHYIYSSVAACDRKTGIPHFESKNTIEQHIKSTGLPATFIRPTSLYENFLFPQVKNRILKAKFVAPLDKNVVQQMVSTEDVGKISAHVFSDPQKYIGKTITLAADQMDQGQMADAFTQALGKEIKYARLPGLITRLAMGKDLHTMFKYINRHGGAFEKDYLAVNKDLPPMMTLKDWIPRHFM